MSEDIELSLEDYFFLEAKERCYEIEVKALKEFEREKKKLFDQEKNSITESFDKRVREETSRRRMYNLSISPIIYSLKSAENNKARLQKMEARNTVMMKIFDEAELHICRKVESEKDFYKDLMKKLIIQVPPTGRFLTQIRPSSS
jgi:V-type H+-transporting ATPase subunit E